MNETYQAALDQLQHERAALQSQYDSLQQKVATLTSEKNAAEGLNRENQLALEDARHKMQDVVSQHSSVRFYISFTTAILVLTHLSVCFLQELEFTSAQIRDLKDKIQRMSQDNEALRRSNTQVRSCLASLFLPLFFSSSVFLCFE